ncbi:MAG: YceI family protein [Bacteroidetes bacterium]|nr:YceI family protein [Bacteroidota bacterium]
MKRTILLFSLILTGIYLNAQTGSKGWKVDKSHTTISFTVPHLVISEVTGTFKDFDMEITAEKADFSDMKVNTVIKVASINTDNTQRDTHLKSDDFFNAEKFPEIKFNGYSVYKVDEKNYKITGDLTIRDVTKKVVFDAVNQGTIKSPWGQTVSVWKASLKLNRFDYNLKWDKKIETGGFVAGDEVTVNLNIELTR